MVLLVAIAIMTTAAIAEGAAVQVFGMDLEGAHVIEAVFTLLGFAVLLVSVLTHKISNT